MPCTRANRDMRSVRCGLAWDLAGSQDIGRQFRHFMRDIKKRKVRENFQSIMCCLGVSCAGFIDDELRKCRVENRPLASPTIPS